MNRTNYKHICKHVTAMLVDIHMCNSKLNICIDIRT